MGGGKSCPDCLGSSFPPCTDEHFLFFVRVQKGASSCVLICLCERLFLCVFFKCVSMPGGRPFCPAMAEPDNWGVTAGDKMLEQKI